MGSCSSGGPNKFTGMCLVKGGEISKRDDQAGAIGREAAFVADSCPRLRFDKAVVKKESTSGDDCEPRMSNAVNSRHCRTPLDCGRKTGLVRRTTPVVCGKREETMDRHCASLGAAVATSGRGFQLEEGRLSAFPDTCGATARRSISQPASSSPLPINAAIIQTDSQRRQQEYQKRKASALLELYRWSGEYGTCIVPPPNRTVFDALLSPCGRLEYSPESGWAARSNDQKAPIDCPDDDGYDGEKGASSSSCGISTDSLSRTASSSTQSPPMPRRRDAGGIGKRSSSVSGCSKPRTFPASAGAGFSGRDVHYRNDACDQQRNIIENRQRLTFPSAPLNRLDNSAFGSASLDPGKDCERQRDVAPINGNTYDARSNFSQT